MSGKPPHFYKRTQATVFQSLCGTTAQKLAGSCSCCFRYLSIINLILKGGRIALTKQAALTMNRWVTQLLSSAAEGDVFAN